MAVTEKKRSVSAGVPLGGVGAGCLEMGLDGRFRNITINNNRTAETRIPVVDGTFLAVRASRKGRVQSRVLQTETGLPWDSASISLPYTTVEQLTWRGLYPVSSYKLSDGTFPLSVKWQGMAPIVPFDLDASTTPVVLITVTLANHTDDLIEASALFNWENICGCTRLHWPEERGRIVPLTLNVHEEGEDTPSGQIVAGLHLGMRDGFRSNADGDYCIAVKPQRNVATTVMTYNGQDAAELEEFWQRFTYEGGLGDTISSNPQAHQGAVCCTTPLEPRSERSITFALAWRCPRFEMGGEDVGNAYCNQFDTARSVVGKAIHYQKYFSNAVHEWQTRLTNSSLPRWLPRMLINSLHVLSTNSIYTRDGRFAMMETPENPVLGALDRRLYSSIGTLLFFPELEQKELVSLAKLQNPSEHERLFRHLGINALNNPERADGDEPLLDLGPKLILMAYRNYVMTGQRVQLEQAYPALKDVMAWMGEHDVDRDGLPEHDGTKTTFEDWRLYGADSYTSSLWIAALRAYSRMARVFGDRGEAERYEGLLRTCLDRFDARLWNETDGFYRLYDNPKHAENGGPRHHEGCTVGQLAGQWYADFLSVGQLWPMERLHRALDALRKHNDSGKGVSRGVMVGSEEWFAPADEAGAPSPEIGWPCVTLGTYSSLQIMNGRCDRGLYAAQKLYEHIHVGAERMFNFPLQWDGKDGDAFGYGKDRHMGVMSAWHVLYALQGFILNAAKQELWVRPNLPLNVHVLNTPLFTPLCLGELSFREQPGPPYSQRVRVSFDSPVPVRVVVLRIPRDAPEVEVSVQNDGAAEATDHVIGYDGEEKLVEVLLKSPITVREGLDVRVTAVRAGAVV